MAADLKEYLPTEVPTLSAGTNLFIGQVQDRPEAATIVGLLPYAGARASEPNFGADDLAFEWPRLQVITRGPADDLEAALTMAHACYEALGRVQAATINGTFYHRVTCLQPPYVLRYDANRRPLVVFNVEGEKRV
jgi:hypothetical protein